MDITKITLFYLFIIAGVFLSAGCNHTQRYMTRNFGNSFNAAFNRQVLNPDAPENPEPAAELPGQIGNQIYKKRYVKGLSEDKKEKQESVGQQLSDLD